MSYPLDLDEISDEKLLAEVQRRAALRMKGLCTYCERPGDTRPCKLPERHEEATRPVRKTIWERLAET